MKVKFELQSLEFADLAFFKFLIKNNEPMFILTLLLRWVATFQLIHMQLGMTRSDSDSIGIHSNFSVFIQQPGLEMWLSGFKLFSWISRIRNYIRWVFLVTAVFQCSFLENARICSSVLSNAKSDFYTACSHSNRVHFDFSVPWAEFYPCCKFELWVNLQIMSVWIPVLNNP